MNQAESQQVLKYTQYMRWLEDIHIHRPQDLSDAEYIKIKNHFEQIYGGSPQNNKNFAGRP